jgi:predicted nuclease of predicted toxin-antitoxin system
VKIKLDENLPDRLVAELQSLGHDADTVRAEHLAGKDDNEVWQAAQAAGRFLITQDLDFSDVRGFTPGTHPGLLLVRLAQARSGSLGRTRCHAVRDRTHRALARLLSRCN